MPALPWRQESLRLRSLGQFQRLLLPGRDASAELPGTQHGLRGMRRTWKQEHLTDSASRSPPLTPPESAGSPGGTQAAATTQAGFFAWQARLRH